MMPLYDLRADTGITLAKLHKCRLPLFALAFALLPYVMHILKYYDQQRFRHHSPAIADDGFAHYYERRR